MAGDLWTLVHAAFTADPSALALVDHAQNVRLTYDELAALVCGVIADLDRHGLGSDDVVLIAHDRSAVEVATVLACVARGVPYVGLDRQLSASRIEELLQRVQPSAIAGSVANIPAEIHVLTDPVVVATDRGAEALPQSSRSSDAGLCYISFTSGSSGVPKGVQVSRGAVTCLIDGAPDYLLDTPSRNYLRLAPLAFDASTYELFVNLVHGGTLHVYPPGPINVEALGAFIEANQIEQMFLTTGLFSAVTRAAAHRLASVRHVLTGGEIISAEVVGQFRSAAPAAVLTNCYGPTEATTFSTTYSLMPGTPIPDPLPIGQPIPGTSIGVLASDELCIAGPRLAVGYLNDDALTDLKFRQLDSTRVYLTGDLVDLDDDGNLVFRGRADRQVKIHGYRVEIDGIEEIIRECPMVSDVMIVPLVDPAGATISGLGCGFVLTIEAQGRIDSDDAVRAWCREHLPGYAVPTKWRSFAQLPINPNGKTDPTAIVAALDTAPVRNDPRPLSSRQADRVRGILTTSWATVLGHTAFDGDDDFFDAGGDSLRVIRLLSSLRSDLPMIELTLADLFVNSRLDQMTSLIENRLKQSETADFEEAPSS